VTPEKLESVGVSSPRQTRKPTSCHAKLGEKTEARDCYDRAVRWTEAHADPIPPILIEDLGTLRADAGL
jgi:hypothetical protein